MGLPELIVTVRYESYSSIKVKSTNTLVKSRAAEIQYPWYPDTSQFHNFRSQN